MNLIILKCNESSVDYKMSTRKLTSTYFPSSAEYLKETH